MALAAANSLSVPASQPLHSQPIHVDLSSTARAKVALFRSLFRGRDDLYARRFESTTTGKSGYAPACANEWVRGICRKPRIKCADCTHRAFLPMTDQVVYWHLCGHASGEPPHRPFVAGVYRKPCWHPHRVKVTYMSCSMTGKARFMSDTVEVIHSAAQGLHRADTIDMQK